MEIKNKMASTRLPWAPRIERTRNNTKGRFPATFPPGAPNVAPKRQRKDDWELYYEFFSFRASLDLCTFTQQVSINRRYRLLFLMTLYARGALSLGEVASAYLIFIIHYDLEIY